MPVLVRVGAITVPAYALLDSGATCSAISSDLAQEIEAKVNQIPLTLRTFGAKSTTYREVTSFTVTNLFETLTMKVENALVSDLLGTDRDKPPSNEITKRYPHLKDVHFTGLRNPAVRLILDAKHAHSWLPKEEKGKYRVALPWKYGREETAKIFSETDFLSTARNRQQKPNCCEIPLKGSSLLRL